MTTTTLAPKLTKKLIKQIDDHIDRIFNANINSRKINVMDIGKIFDAGHAAHAAAGSVKDAVLAAMDELCFAA